MDFNRTSITEGPQETAELGERIAKSGIRLVCLYGNLGSGKTTFTQGYAKGLGITGRLLSPTFIIVRRYQLSDMKKFFYHIDLYRMEDTLRLQALGLEEIFLDIQNYVAIEWPERLGDVLPKDRMDIRFSTQDDGKHTISII